jgi:geranylgeranyl reductase family protein
MAAPDVLIVGGGPAGSTCARALEQAGLRTRILDRAIFPRDKVCGGWISPPVLEELQIDPRDYGAGRTLQPITGFRVGAIGQRQVELRYGRVVSYGIRRREFDDYLLRRSGAEVVTAEAVETIERQGSEWVVNGEHRAPMLVGAGGHFCPVSRALGNGRAGEPVVAQEVEYEMDAEEALACGIEPEVPELFFCRDLRGYGWCFRKDDVLNLGLGRMDAHDLRRHVLEFLEYLRQTGKVRLEDKVAFQGHAYLLFGYSPRRLVEDGVLLVGDSAGLAYAQSGEGIRPAVESALLAAQVMVEAGGDYAKERLASYPARLAERFGRDPGRLESLARRLPEAVRNLAGRLLLTLPWFCRDVVVDEWFLHAGQAALTVEMPQPVA